MYAAWLCMVLRCCGCVLVQASLLSGLFSWLWRVTRIAKLMRPVGAYSVRASVIAVHAWCAVVGFAVWAAGFPNASVAAAVYTALLAAMLVVVLLTTRPVAASQLIAALLSVPAFPLLLGEGRHSVYELLHMAGVIPDAAFVRGVYCD